MVSPQMGLGSGTPWNLSILPPCSKQGTCAPVWDLCTGGSLEEVAVEVDLKAQRIPAAGLGVIAVRSFSTARAEEPHPFSSSPLAL